MRTYKTTGPICAARLPAWFRSERPAANRKTAIIGNVYIEDERREKA